MIGVLKRWLSNFRSIAKESLNESITSRSLEKNADPVLLPIDSITTIESRAVDLPVIHILYKKSLIGSQVLAHQSEESILENPEGFLPYEVEGRKRIATCAGLSWFAGHHLAAVNLYGQHLRIYKLEESYEAGEKKMGLKLLHQLSEDIAFPEDVAVSPDCSLIAISHSLAKEKGVTVRRMDNETFEPKAAFQKLRIENTAHGIHFSPDSHFLAFTTVDSPGTIEVYNVRDLPIQRVCLLTNNHPHLRPKDVCFTSDANFVAIIYSEIINPKFVKRTIVGKRLTIHRFDAKTGMIEEKSLAAFDSDNSLFGSFELAAFRPDINPKEYRLFITNQAQDKVVEVAFNPDQLSLRVSGSHRSNLSFPHGVDVSGDSNLIAVTNFGDDYIRILELENELDITKDTRTHILLCGHSVSPQLFGAERSLIDLAIAFSHLGYKVSCLLPHENDEYTDELARYVDAVFHLSFDWSNHTRPFDEYHVGLIADLIQRELVDIVHSNSMVIPDVQIAARRKGIPCVLHARELIQGDHKIANYMGARSENILQNLTRDFDFIIANSIATKSQFPVYKNLFCLYNTIDVNRFNLPVISSNGPLKVGMISNNTQRKGLLDFIELSKTAIAETLLEFYLIGPKNPEVEKVELELRKDPNPPKIYFIDYVPDPVKAIAMIDVVISLSAISESFGRTIAEGMAARRPVIVYNRGAMPELVKHQETGFLIMPGDLTGVLESLRWLEANRDKARVMGDAGRHFVVTNFSPELFQKNLKGIYEHILQIQGL